MKLRRFYINARCAVGIHRLKAWEARESFAQEDAYPIPPRCLPGPGDFRRCTWCGARWRGAYDGIEPFWMREGGQHGE